MKATILHTLALASLLVAADVSASQQAEQATQAKYAQPSLEKPKHFRYVKQRPDQLARRAWTHGHRHAAELNAVAEWESVLSGDSSDSALTAGAVSSTVTAASPLRHHQTHRFKNGSSRLLEPSSNVTSSSVTGTTTSSPSSSGSSSAMSTDASSSDASSGASSSDKSSSSSSSSSSLTSSDGASSSTTKPSSSSDSDDTSRSTSQSSRASNSRSTSHSTSRSSLDSSTSSTTNKSPGSTSSIPKPTGYGVSSKTSESSSDQQQQSTDSLADGIFGLPNIVNSVLHGASASSTSSAAGSATQTSSTKHDETPQQSATQGSSDAETGRSTSPHKTSPSPSAAATKSSSTDSSGSSSASLSSQSADDSSNGLGGLLGGLGSIFQGSQSSSSSSQNQHSASPTETHSISESSRLSSSGSPKAHHSHSFKSTHSQSDDVSSGTASPSSTSHGASTGGDDSLSSSSSSTSSRTGQASVDTPTVHGSVHGSSSSTTRVVPVPTAGTTQGAESTSDSEAESVSEKSSVTSPTVSSRPTTLSSALSSRPLTSSTASSISGVSPSSSLSSQNVSASSPATATAMPTSGSQTSSLLGSTQSSNSSSATAISSSSSESSSDESSSTSSASKGGSTQAPYWYAPTSSLMMPDDNTSSSTSNPASSSTSASSSTQTQSTTESTASADSISWPSAILPDAEEVAQPSNTSMISALLSPAMKWKWMIEHPDTTSQVLAFMPGLLSRAIDGEDSDVTLVRLQSYSPDNTTSLSRRSSDTTEAITTTGSTDDEDAQTLYVAYFPTSKVEDLQAAIRNTSSPCYVSDDLTNAAAQQLAVNIDTTWNVTQLSSKLSTNALSRSEDKGKNVKNGHGDTIRNVVVAVASATVACLIAVCASRWYRSRKRAQRLLQHARRGGDVSSAASFGPGAFTPSFTDGQRATAPALQSGENWNDNPVMVERDGASAQRAASWRVSSHRGDPFADVYGNRASRQTERGAVSSVLSYEDPALASMTEAEQIRAAYLIREGSHDDHSYESSARSVSPSSSRQLSYVQQPQQQQQRPTSRSIVPMGPPSSRGPAQGEAPRRWPSLTRRGSRSSGTTRISQPEMQSNSLLM